MGLISDWVLVRNFFAEELLAGFFRSLLVRYQLAAYWIASDSLVS